MQRDDPHLDPEDQQDRLHCRFAKEKGQGSGLFCQRFKREQWQKVTLEIQNLAARYTFSLARPLQTDPGKDRKVLCIDSNA